MATPRARRGPVLILGGGPAGLATALALARHRLAAVVIERSTYTDLRIGEHLAPAGALQLRALDPCLSPDAHSASAGVEAYWGSETASHMDYFLHPGRRGLNLSRPRFDADLARACESSGATVLRSASLLHASRARSGWDAVVETGGKTRNFPAAMVVDATGRAATFSRRQGARVRAHDRQIAVAAFERHADDGNGSRSLVEAVETGWWYSAPAGPGRRSCMLMTDDDMLPKAADLQAWWLAQLNRTIRLRRRFRDGRSPQCLVVRAARSQHVDVISGTGWLAVGDAAMAFDPLTSYGIAKALDHGKRAAASIAACLAGDALALQRLARELEGEYAAYRTTRSQYYRLEMRWPEAPFWKRRHQALAA